MGCHPNFHCPICQRHLGCKSWAGLTSGTECTALLEFTIGDTHKPAKKRNKKFTIKGISSLNEKKSCLFFPDYTVQLRHSQRTHTHPLWTHVRKPYPYEHLRRLSRQILEIDEVTTDASLSTEMSPTTECTMSLNPRIFAPMGSRT